MEIILRDGLKLELGEGEGEAIIPLTEGDRYLLTQGQFAISACLHCITIVNVPLEVSDLLAGSLVCIPN